MFGNCPHGRRLFVPIKLTQPPHPNRTSRLQSPAGGGGREEVYVRR